MFWNAILRYIWSCFKQRERKQGGRINWIGCKGTCGTVLLCIIPRKKKGWIVFDCIFGEHFNFNKSVKFYKSVRKNSAWIFNFTNRSKIHRESSSAHFQFQSFSLQKFRLSSVFILGDENSHSFLLSFYLTSSTAFSREKTRKILHSYVHITTCSCLKTLLRHIFYPKLYLMYITYFLIKFCNNKTDKSCLFWSILIEVWNHSWTARAKRQSQSTYAHM